MRFFLVAFLSFLLFSCVWNGGGRAGSSVNSKLPSSKKTMRSTKDGLVEGSGYNRAKSSNSANSGISLDKDNSESQKKRRPLYNKMVLDKIDSEPDSSGYRDVDENLKIAYSNKDSYGGTFAAAPANEPSKPLTQPELAAAPSNTGPSANQGQALSSAAGQNQGLVNQATLPNSKLVETKESAAGVISKPSQNVLDDQVVKDNNIVDIKPVAIFAKQASGNSNNLGSYRSPSGNANDKPVKNDNVVKKNDKNLNDDDDVEPEDGVIVGSDDESNDDSSENDNESVYYFVQAGAFVNKDEALDVVKLLSSVAKFKIQSAKVKGKTYYRVRSSAMSSNFDAENLLDKVVQTGHYDVYIVKEAL